MNDGGPAFPVPNYVNADGETFESEPSGMSLRDYFAGQVIAECWRAQAENLQPKAAAAMAATVAYIIADAMVAAR